MFLWKIYIKYLIELNEPTICLLFEEYLLIYYDRKDYKQDKEEGNNKKILKKI